MKLKHRSNQSSSTSLIVLAQLISNVTITPPVGISTDTYNSYLHNAAGVGTIPVLAPVLEEVGVVFPAPAAAAVAAAASAFVAAVAAPLAGSAYARQCCNVCCLRVTVAKSRGWDQTAANTATHTPHTYTGCYIMLHAYVIMLILK